MATIMHSCNSPRRHQNNSTLSHFHQQLPSLNYSKSSKYTRSTPSYCYEENYISSTNHFHSSQARHTSLSPGNLQKQQFYGNGKRPSSIGPTSNLSGIWVQSPREINQGNIKHYQKHKTAVEILAETKTLYMKPGPSEQRYQDTMYMNHSLTDFSKRSGCCREEDSTALMRHGKEADLHYASKYRFPRSKLCLERRNITSSNIFHKKCTPLMDKESRPNVSYGTQDSIREYENYNDFGEYYLKNILSSGVKKLHSHPGMNVPYSDSKCSPEEPLVLTENYRPISPPAEYAAEPCYWNQKNRIRQNYKRSFSHSQETATKNLQRSIQNYNLDSHKSLPDLYSQSNRQSPHSEILSCCSRGNRSIKSIDESSFNRDSGGSSGHFTGSKSEPCCRRDIPLSSYRKNCCEMPVRRDSGSSTQHSSNSIYKSLSPSGQPILNCHECICKPTSQETSSDFSFNFLTPEVPVQFQDDYIPSASPPKGFKVSLNTQGQKNFSVTKNEHTQQSQRSLAPSPDSVLSVEESNTPPPMQFKRQKCIRFKNRNRNFTIGSNQQNINASIGQNEILSYSIQCDAPKDHFDICSSTRNDIVKQDTDANETTESNSLEKFFDRLGLNDETFQEIYIYTKRRGSGGTNNSDNSSTVFFSDVSTVDSMRFPDSTDTNSQATQTYRPSEPPSIVERNARIIKWLCNCRKSHCIQSNLS